MRAIGIRRLREYTDPASFELLTSLFFDEDDETRDAVLDHLASLDTPEADAAIAWEAVYNEKAEHRAASLETLVELSDLRPTPTLVTDVFRSGLRERSDEPAEAAAHAAASLRLFELIPLMASAQVAGGRAGDPQGDLAWIFVGTQQTFVADVQPIVSDNTVAFDPQLAVVSEGSILRVSGAYVAIYRVAINRSLIGMTSEAWGQSTASMGYDTDAWHAWYEDEFKPFLAAKAAIEPPAQP
ncbi:MAG: hypothetical protein AAGI53_11390 [Planctomycetota bacterium]